MRDVDLLASFHAIAAAPSLTAAAARLGLTQSTLSVHLAALEDRAGGPLVVRTSRGIELTHLGRDLEARIGPSLDRLGGTLASMQTRSTHGVVRLGGASDIVALRLVPELAPLIADGIAVHVTLGLADDLNAALARGDLDVVISALRPRTAGVVAVPWLDEELVLVASPALIAPLPSGMSDADAAARLGALPLVAYDTAPSLIRRYWRSAFGTPPPGRVSLAVADLRAVLAGVVAGIGLGVLPRFVAGAAIASGSITVVHEPEIAPQNTLYLARGRTAPAAPATDTVMARLLEAASRWDVL